MQLTHSYAPRWVAGIHALIAATWITLSDGLLTKWQSGTAHDWLLHSVKGLAFVAVTSGGLYWLLHRQQRRLQISADAALANERHMVDEAAFSTALFSHSPIGMITYSAHGPALSANAAAAEIVGATVEQVCSENFWKNESWRTTGLLDAAEEALRAGTKVRRELEITTTFGRHLWMWATFVPFRYRNEERLLLLLADITARKQAEQKIAAAGEFTRATLDSLTIGIAILDDTARILSINRAWRNLARENSVPEAQFGEGANYFEAMRTTCGADAVRTEELVSGVRAVAARQRAEFSVEYPCLISNHKRWYLIRATHFGGSGPGCVVITHENITVRREALAQLHLMHAALQAAPNGCVVTDVNGVVEWANDGFTKLTGYTLSEVRGSTMRMIKSDRHPPEFYADLWRTIKTGQIWSGEVVNRRKDGTIYPEQMTIAPLRDAQGEIIHFVAIKQDISEHKQLEQQFARTQRLESIGLLASGIAHDLNNIFAPILLSIDLLKEKYPSSDGRKTLEMIEAAGRRGAAIVRQVLTFARGLEGERTPIQPRYLVRETEQMLRETLPRQIELKLHVPHDLSPVIGDATQLQQVLLNLAINARDAMTPDGGVLTISGSEVLIDAVSLQRHPALRKAGCYVALKVTDTGTGIAPETLEHIFEPFFTTKPRGKGTGLGLSTAYGIVRSHGGAVEVTTEIGRGSEFVVLIPAGEKDAGFTDSAPPFDLPLQGAGRRVLVVDDEESIRLITLHALQRHGFVVEVAADGVEGSERFREAPDRYAVVLTDLMMPRRNGRDLIREIRRLAPRQPVIASSGLSDENGRHIDQEALSSLGVHSVLHKPYTEAELLAALRRALTAAAAATLASIEDNGS